MKHEQHGEGAGQARAADAGRAHQLQQLAPAARLPQRGSFYPAGQEVREPLSRFTRPFNTTHQPVAVLPAPLPLGLPVGIQVAGRNNADTLRAAAWLEGQWALAR